MTVKISHIRLNPCNGRREVTAFTQAGRQIASCYLENKAAMVTDLEEDGYKVLNPDSSPASLDWDGKKRTF